MSDKEKMELLLKKADDIGWTVVSDNLESGFAFERGEVVLENHSQAGTPVSIAIKYGMEEPVVDFIEGLRDAWFREDEKDLHEMKRELSAQVEFFNSDFNVYRQAMERIRAAAPENVEIDMDRLEADILCLPFKNLERATKVISNVLTGEEESFVRFVVRECIDPESVDPETRTAFLEWLGREPNVLTGEKKSFARVFGMLEGVDPEARTAFLEWLGRERLAAQVIRHIGHESYPEEAAREILRIAPHLPESKLDPAPVEPISISKFLSCDPLEYNPSTDFMFLLEDDTTGEILETISGLEAKDAAGKLGSVYHSRPSGDWWHKEIGFDKEKVLSALGSGRGRKGGKNENDKRHC